jgi:hypothetical protein
MSWFFVRQWLPANKLMLQFRFTSINCVIPLLFTIALGGTYHIYTHFVAWVDTRNQLF